MKRNSFGRNSGKNSCKANFSNILLYITFTNNKSIQWIESNENDLLNLSIFTDIYKRIMKRSFARYSRNSRKVAELD